MTSVQSPKYEVEVVLTGQDGNAFAILGAVDRALRSDVGFGIYYAISGNSTRKWDIANTMADLGYQPEDDASRHWPIEPR